MLPKILLGVLVVGVVAVIYLFAQKNAGDDEKKEAAKGSQEVKIEESEDLKKTEETSATSDKKNAEDKKAEDKSKDDSKADEQKNDEKKQEEKATQALAVVSAQGNETAYELKNADKFELTVTTTGETWINILNGKGTSFFQGMLKKGATESQTVDFSKETEAVVVVGRSSDTEIFVNGQKLEYAVPVTEEVRQDITIRYVPPTQ
nr:RodZ domain-containing protein [Bacillus sp. DNRA2]